MKLASPQIPRLVLLLAAIACAAVLAACGGDSDEGGSTGSGAGLDPEAAAHALADCTTSAGLEGTVTQPDIPDAMAVDLTTEDQTIIVEVFASPDAAATYENPADLDQEIIDNYVIIGGTIKPTQHEIIIGCIPSSS